jgi:nicotinamidase-related amidase
VNIELRRAALMVIDVQNGFINQSSAAVVPVVRELAAWWAGTGRPTIFTRYWNYSGSPWQSLLGWHALAGPPDTDLVDELTTLAESKTAHVLDKTTYTAFTADGAALLKRLGVGEVVLCGIATDACVLKTAIDAFELGYIPWVVRDAVASNSTRRPAHEIHKSALGLLSRLIGAGQLIDTHHLYSAVAAPTSSPAEVPPPDPRRRQRGPGPR